MDIKRSGKSKLKKKVRTGILIAVGLIAVGGITFGLTKLKPASPTLDRSTAVIDTVKRGQMLREVRGIGTLVPQDVRWLPAPSEGRVERIPQPIQDRKLWPASGRPEDGSGLWRRHRSRRQVRLGL